MYVFLFVCHYLLFFHLCISFIFSCVRAGPHPRHPRLDRGVLSIPQVHPARDGGRGDQGAGGGTPHHRHLHQHSVAGCEFVTLGATPPWHLVPTAVHITMPAHSFEKCIFFFSGAPHAEATEQQMVRFFSAAALC